MMGSRYRFPQQTSPQISAWGMWNQMNDLCVENAQGYAHEIQMQREAARAVHRHVAKKYRLEHVKPSKLKQTLPNLPAWTDNRFVVRMLPNVYARWELHAMLMLLDHFEHELSFGVPILHSWNSMKEGKGRGFRRFATTLLVDVIVSCEHETFVTLRDTLERFTAALMEDGEPMMRVTNEKLAFHSHHLPLALLHAATAMSAHATVRERTNVAPYADLLYLTCEDLDFRSLRFGDSWWETAVFEFGQRHILSHVACPPHVADIVEVGS